MTAVEKELLERGVVSLVEDLSNHIVHDEQNIETGLELLVKISKAALNPAQIQRRARVFAGVMSVLEARRTNEKNPVESLTVEARIGEETVDQEALPRIGLTEHRGAKLRLKNIAGFRGELNAPRLGALWLVNLHAIDYMS